MYDVQNKHVCYLKDTWRFNSADFEQEGETYKKLHEEKVPHIANVVAHGDVVLAGKGPKAAPTNSIRMNRRSANSAGGLDQQSVSQSGSNCSNNHMTLTEKFFDKSWELREQPLHDYVHDRLVLNVVGRGLTSFLSTKEVVQVFIDTLEGKILSLSVTSLLITIYQHIGKHTQKQEFCIVTSV